MMVEMAKTNTTNSQPKRKKPAPKRVQKRTLPKIGREILFESDSTYLLKLIIVVILGTLWLKFSTPVIWLGLSLNALPLGLLAGIVAIKLLEKHQTDRKIWYAVLIVIGIVSYFVPAGIVI